jgi:Zn-dependent protease
VNLSLMVFNLLPIGPLDGAKVAVAFLSDRHALEFERFQERWGWIALFLLIFAGGPVLQLLVGQPVYHLAGLLIRG